MTMDLRAFLASSPHLDRLSADDLGILSRALLVQAYPAGHELLREGHRAEEVLLLIEGEVEVGRVRDGTWDPLERLSPGALFGLVALVDCGPQFATCRAATPVVVGSLSRSVFSILMGQHAPIAQAFQRALCSQLARESRNLERQIRAELARYRVPRDVHSLR